MTQEARVLLGIGILTTVIIVGAVFFLSKDDNSTADSANSSIDTRLLVRDNSHKIATSSAQVTIVEFGDYQCPACRAVEPVLEQIIKEYSGKINFVFRNFPLSQHKNALISAEAAEAASAQGKFWEMHDKLYQEQDKWGESENPLEYLKTYAKELGLDENKFLADIAGKKYADLINQDLSDGIALKTSSTPTIFVGDKKLVGVPTYQELKALLDSKLTRE